MLIVTYFNPTIAMAIIVSLRCGLSEHFRISRRAKKIILSPHLFYKVYIHRILPQFTPMKMKVEPAVVDETSKQSAISQDESSRQSVGDKSDSESTSPNQDSPDTRSAIPRVKDKKEAAEIFKQLLRDKVCQCV